MANFTGTNNSDYHVGTAGDDSISGLAGYDVLLGEGGNDVIDGGADIDNIVGGQGADTITGGPGADGFSGDAAELDGDLYTDFDIGETFAINGLSAVSTLEVANAPFNITFNGSTFAAAKVNIDIDGNGTVDSSFHVATATGQSIEIDTSNINYGTASINTFDVPIGDSIFDVGQLDMAFQDYLFGGNNSGLTVTNASYVGSAGAVGFLPNGYSFVDTQGNAVATIENGIFLSSGGAPGTTNTSSSFTVSNSQLGDSDLDAAAQAAFSGSGTTLDASVIEFTLNSTVDGFVSLDLIFGSDEYPEYADSSFVDIAAVYVNGKNYGLFNNDTSQPIAIVGDSISTPGNFFDNTGSGYQTEYDGFSRVLTIVVPVEQGANDIKIGVADTGDAALDSGLFVGNVQYSDVSIGGAYVNNKGTTGNDAFEANAAPEIFYMESGGDSIQGTPEELDGDFILDWGDDDKLIVEAIFSEDDVQITMGSAIIDIDSDQDGTFDSTVTLQGDFENAQFAFDQDNGTTVISTTGAGQAVPAENLEGNDGNDSLVGTNGNDTLRGRGGNDTLIGEGGDDIISASDGDDLVDAGAGNDRVGGGLGDDSIDGGSGEDTIGSGQDNDTVNAGDGNDRVAASFGDDVVDGGAGSDSLAGHVGADSILGGAGDDNIGGGYNNDTINGGADNDTIGAGQQDDLVYGASGDDVLNGNNGSDTIYGGAGDDTIAGGDHNDVLTGGGGADVFKFRVFNAGTEDVITDFTRGEDTLEMRGNFAGLTITDHVDGIRIEKNGHVIVLEGVDTLTADDFNFV
jgi:Ca2+-binding RTX toxin-like protein